MKARLVPIYFAVGRDADFDVQLVALKRLLETEADILEPVALGAEIPEADAVVFPQMLGQAYRQLADFKQITVPRLIITSEFGTVSMWDWEIAAYLGAEGVETVAPYNLDQAKMLCRGLGVRRELAQTKFLVFQDNPGEGFQASIFKRFYWWEDECSERIKRKFGLTIEKRSFREFGERAKQIPDAEAEDTWRNWQLKTEDVTPRALAGAVKVYIALKRELDSDPSIRAMGINCLNESHFSDTTPCLAWNMLFEERGLIWGCEADTMAMLSKFILHRSLGVPLMMTNLYPFLMGNAALKHEHIESFPERTAPENCILVAHCGYLGVLPTSFATEWTLRPKVLAIVDDNATAIDARLPSGPMTLAKLDPSLERMTVAEGELDSYAQYPDSHCRNGAVLRVQDGHRFMNRLASHHYILMTGHQRAQIEMLGKVLDLAVEAI